MPLNLNKLCGPACRVVWQGWTAPYAYRVQVPPRADHSERSEAQLNHPKFCGGHIV
jgi:hypothetical protein